MYTHKWHEKGKEDEEEENQMVGAPNLFQSSNLCFNLLKILNPSTPTSLQVSKSQNSFAIFVSFLLNTHFWVKNDEVAIFTRSCRGSVQWTKIMRGILILCNSGSIWAAAQKFHIESCRGSVLFLLKIDFFPSKWVTPMCFGILSFILTSHLTWL